MSFQSLLLFLLLAPAAFCATLTRSASPVSLEELTTNVVDDVKQVTTEEVQTTTTFQSLTSESDQALESVEEKKANSEENNKKVNQITSTLSPSDEQKQVLPFGTGIGMQNFSFIPKFVSDLMNQDMMKGTNFLNKSQTFQTSQPVGASDNKQNGITDSIGSMLGQNITAYQTQYMQSNYTTQPKPSFLNDDPTWNKRVSSERPESAVSESVDVSKSQKNEADSKEVDNKNQNGKEDVKEESKESENEKMSKDAKDPKGSKDEHDDESHSDKENKEEKDHDNDHDKDFDKDHENDDNEDHENDDNEDHEEDKVKKNEKKKKKGKSKNRNKYEQSFNFANLPFLCPNVNNDKIDETKKCPNNQVFNRQLHMCVYRSGQCGFRQALGSFINKMIANQFMN